MHRCLMYAVSHRRGRVASSFVSDYPDRVLNNKVDWVGAVLFTNEPPIMQERHMSANKGRPNGSVGNKQVAAALQGMGLPCIPTLHTCL